MNFVFSFTCDNAQLARDEIEQQIKNIGCIASNTEIVNTTELKNSDDWFDDVTFHIRANVKSEIMTDAEIKQAIHNGNFEGYEFVE